MQFDPTNLKNVETRIKITGDRMQSLQSKAQITRTAMEQLGKTMTTFRNADGTAKTVKDVAESTDNLSEGKAGRRALQQAHRLSWAGLRGMEPPLS